MSEKEIWEKHFEMGRLVRKPNGEIVVTDKVYHLLGWPMPGVGDLEGFCAKYRLLWPSGIKSGNLYVRSGISTIMGKMRLFRKKFPHYTEEIILTATQRYIDECRRENYQYMKTAEYFIFKNDGSTLETYCELIKDDDLKPINHSNLRVV